MSGRKRRIKDNGNEETDTTRGPNNSQQSDQTMKKPPKKQTKRRYSRAELLEIVSEWIPEHILEDWPNPHLSRFIKGKENQRDASEEVKAAWKDIEEIAGEGFKYPYRIQMYFWADAFYGERLVIMAFLYINGVNPELFYDFLTARRMPNMRKRLKHYRSIQNSFENTPERYSNLYGFHVLNNTYEKFSGEAIPHVSREERLRRKKEAEEALAGKNLSTDRCTEESGGDDINEEEDGSSDLNDALMIQAIEDYEKSQGVNYQQDSNKDNFEDSKKNDLKQQPQQSSKSHLTSSVTSTNTGPNTNPLRSTKTHTTSSPAAIESAIESPQNINITEESGVQSGSRNDYRQDGCDTSATKPTVTDRIATDFNVKTLIVRNEDNETQIFSDVQLMYIIESKGKNKTLVVEVSGLTSKFKHISQTQSSQNMKPTEPEDSLASQQTACDPVADVIHANTEDSDGHSNGDSGLLSQENTTSRGNIDSKQTSYATDDDKGNETGDVDDVIPDSADTTHQDVQTQLHGPQTQPVTSSPKLVRKNNVLLQSSCESLSCTCPDLFPEIDESKGNRTIAENHIINSQESISSGQTLSQIQNGQVVVMDVSPANMSILDEEYHFNLEIGDITLNNCDKIKKICPKKNDINDSNLYGLFHTCDTAHNRRVKEKVTVSSSFPVTTKQMRSIIGSEEYVQFIETINNEWDEFHADCPVDRQYIHPKVLTQHWTSGKKLKHVRFDNVITYISSGEHSAISEEPSEIAKIRRRELIRARLSKRRPDYDPDNPANNETQIFTVRDRKNENLVTRVSSVGPSIVYKAD